MSLCGCTFNTSTNASGDGPAATIDSGMRPDAIDPADCPEDIHIEVRVGGVDAPASQNGPYLHTIIGDTVELSAVGTCTRSGVIQYRWIIGPATTLVQDTALPNLVSETITVYSLVPDTYDVRLEISDGNTTEAVSIFAFDAHGFTKLSSYQGNNIRDLSAGADYLWVGADDGAYRGTLATPLVDFPNVDDAYGGDDLQDKMHVHETSDGARVWFSSEDSEGKAFALELNPASNLIESFDTEEDAKTRDIDDAETGIRFATDKGVVVALDSQDFQVERGGDDTSAVSFGPTGSWAGRDSLYPLPAGDEISLFDGNDDIQALDDDGTLLWIGSDSDGVVTFANNAIVSSYTQSSGDLPSDDVETIAIDSALDVWIGTAKGVVRFKRDRQVWVTLDGNSGLDGAIDIDAIAVDEAGGRRGVFVGTDDELFIMTAP